MSELSTRLVDERLPYAPYRQWTFTFPWRIRVALAQDGRLLPKVLSICKRKVFANQRKRARRLGIASDSGGRSLAVTFARVEDRATREYAYANHLGHTVVALDPGVACRRKRRRMLIQRK